MSKEIWKDIKGFEGLYQVSNLGNVKSLRNNIIMKPGKVHGYFGVGLRKNNKTKSFRLHRLVAKAFIPNPKNKPQVNHINGIKTDNRVENLEWNTAKENIRHAEINGFKNSDKILGEKNYLTNLTKENVLFIRKRYKEGGITHRELGNIFNVTAACIYNILKRKNWKHI